MTDERIAIGIIRTSFGIKGELKIKSLSGETEHFLSLEEVFLKDKENRFLLYKVEYSRVQKDTIILKLAGIDTPEKGKALSGTEIWVNRLFACPKHEGEYYFADICGCTAYLKKKPLGRIKAVIEGNVAELLEIQTNDGKIVLVPFIDKYVGTVDIQNKKILLKEESELL